MIKIDEKLNEEYRDILKQMRVLNKKRYEIFLKFLETNPDATVEYMRTPSMYHDLFGNDMDKDEPPF
jgi:hypothetical protein